MLVRFIQNLDKTNCGGGGVSSITEGVVTILKSDYDNSHHDHINLGLLIIALIIFSIFLYTLWEEFSAWSGILFFLFRLVLAESSKTKKNPASLAKFRLVENKL